MPDITGAVLAFVGNGAASAGELVLSSCSTGGPEHAASSDAAQSQVDSSDSLRIIMLSTGQSRGGIPLRARKLDVRHTFSQPAGGCGRQINSS